MNSLPDLTLRLLYLKAFGNALHSELYNRKNNLRITNIASMSGKMEK